MYPTTTAGCAELTQVEGTAGRPELKCLDFDPSSDENARTEGQYNQNPVVIIGLYNSGNQGVYKGGYLEFESV